MKTLLVSLAAVASLAAAAPALAQPFGGFPHEGAKYGAPMREGFVDVRFFQGIDQRIDFLFARLGQAQRQGAVDFRQAMRLQNQLREVRWMEQRYRFQDGGPLNGWQRAQLNGRLDGVAGQLRFDTW